MSGKKVNQPTISRFFSSKSAKKSENATNAREKKVISSPFGKRPRSVDNDEDPFSQKTPKQLKLDGSLQPDTPNVPNTDEKSTLKSLSVGTMEKLHNFSLESSKNNTEQRDCNAESISTSYSHHCVDTSRSRQSDGCKTKTFRSSSETADTTPRNGAKFSGDTPGNGSSSSRLQGTPGNKLSRLGALKEKFTFDSSPSPSPSRASVGINGQSGKKVSRTKSQYTPLEQQFMSIKERNSDAVLLVECGYRYRFFGEDAEIAAKELNIVCHPDHNFMTASIPTYRLFVHVRRLVAKGHKVGVVKQMETAALKAAGDNKSQPFERKLTALYTKSTLIGEDLEPSNQDGDLSENQASFSSSPSSYLLCLYEFVKDGAKSPKKSENTEIGLVAVQPATGDIIYDCFHDNDHLSNLDTRLHHIQPVELLLPENLSGRVEKLLRDFSLSSQNEDCIRSERLPKDVFHHEAAFEEVSSFFSSQPASDAADISGTSANLHSVLNLPRPVVSCLAALLHYLKEFNLHSILQVTSNMVPFTSSRRAMKLDACALRNLEILHNQVDGSERGTLLWILNHTRTRFGKRHLIKWLSQPLLDIIDINARLDAVTEIMECDSQQLKGVCDLLSRTPDLERGLASIYHKKCSASEFVTVTRSLSQLRLAAKALNDCGTSGVTSPLLTSIFSEIPSLLDEIDTFVAAVNANAVKEGNKTNLFADPSQFPAVHQCMLDIKEVKDHLVEHRKEWRREIGLGSADYITVSGNEYLVEVKNTMLKKVPKEWIPISSTKQVSRFRPPCVEVSFKRLSQLREQLAAECHNAWIQFLESFGEKYFSYRKAVRHLASFDCLLSFAKVSRQEGFSRPTVHDGPCKIEITGGRHPVVSALKTDGEQYVPNDTAIDVEGTSCMVITGPNMGGKSSYIKQVALLALMAQIGCYVPAESASLGVLDAIYTRMGASDDLFRHRSTFMSELLEASDILSQATPRSLVIMDELGRGTSTHDGVAIAYATAMHLISEVHCLTLFVTHYPPLAALKDHFPSQVGIFHMSFLLHDDEGDKESSVERLTFLYQLVDGAAGDRESNVERLTFLYQLAEGAAGRSYGLNVARLAEIPDTILDTAAGKSRSLENTVRTRRSTREEFVNLWRVESASAASSERVRRILDSLRAEGSS